jgi:uncharacterized membrane protein
MKKEEQIEALRQELAILQQEANRQQAQINQLHRQMQALTGLPVSEPPLPKGQTVPAFSLENFIGLRLIHFVGMIVLVIGLSIGVKYAIDRKLISEALRILLAYGAGLVLYFLSFRLRSKYTLFSAILFSGAMASLYFTTYAAYSYYHLFSFALAFALMIALTGLTIFEAIRYGRQEIALLGLVGAYAIPFLISRNTDQPQLYFLYISFINLAIAYLSIRMDWTAVSRAAQHISWLLFLSWAARETASLAPFTGLAFMLYFFLLFTLIPALRKWRKGREFSISDTYSLLLNNGALYLGSLFVLGYATDASLAWITFSLSVFIALQSLTLFYFDKEEQFTIRMLSSFSFLLFILFIQFNWSGFIVTLLWLLCAISIFIFGLKFPSVRVRLAAILLLGLTLGKLLLFDSRNFSTIQKVVAYLVLGVLLLVVSFFYQKFREQLFGTRGNE